MKDKKIKVYVVINKELVEISSKEFGNFFENECYVIDLTYMKPNNKEFRTIYYWLVNNK